MKKAGFKILFILGLAYALSGCSKGTEQALGDTQQQETDAELEQEKFLELEGDALNYQEETDAQTFFGNGSYSYVAGSENGYYCWEGMNQNGYGRLMFWDVSSGKYIPLCNRPDCSHNEVDCNAYFNARGEAGDYFDRNYIQYYEGNVYIVGYDTEKNVNLYRVAPDGSAWEKYMRLYRADLSVSSEDAQASVGTVQESWSVPRVCIHRGYAYFDTNKEKIPHIWRIRLGADEPEVVYEAVGEHADIGALKAYGDYIFFSEDKFLDENYENYERKLYAYHVETGECSLVKKGVISAYVVQADAVYYILEAKLHRYSLTTGEDVLVTQQQTLGDILARNIHTDEQHIYIFNWETGTLSVYDSQGTELASLMDDSITDYYGGDGKYLFAECSKSEMEESGMAVLDVEKLLDGKGKWELLGGGAE